MYKGNYNRKRRLRWRKEFVLLCSVAALLVGFVGSTIAYLFTETAPVENVFTPGKITINVDEKFEDNVKENVKITNSGNTDAYIRAMIVVTWQNEAGDIYPAAPQAGTDYTISLGSDWSQSGMYYYYKQSVAAGDLTTDLIVRCEPVAEKTPDGYFLVVEIIAEAIQAEPDNVVVDEWGFTPTSGN